MKASFLLLFLAASLHAETVISWQRQQLHGDFYSEGAGIGDINGDGKPDIVAGPFWWEGPAFEKKHAYYEPKIFSINGYSDNFFAYVQDFNADQRNDILILGFPGKEARLYLNPGTHDDKPWPMHIVADVVDNESPVFTDITGDGKSEIVCSTAGRFGWFAPNWDKPTEKWPFVAVSDDLKVAKFTHGLGVGDVNGDGKLDLLEARRWWQNNGTDKWTQHNFAAGIGGGAQMFAYDFDGNGTNDVFTSLAAHRYGVAVYLQNKTGNREPGTGTWTRRMLASEQPQDNDYGIVFSQPHAAYLADINGDGIKDIVTGKRYWAHNGHDPDERGARVIYWYETKRDGKGGVDFVPHLVDADSGVGVDVQVGDVNGDTLPDIVVANKAGVYILTQQRKDTTADLTPKKLYGPALKPQAEYAKGQSPADAMKSMQLPGGFKAELIAAEPDLVQPIAFTFDERGRIWVVEGNSYPQPREVGKGQDRIKILEDLEGDGTFETKKIFCEGLNLVSGIELGFGGVWVGAAPYLMFIPDEDKDDHADALVLNGRLADQVPGVAFRAKILLDGWGSQDTHETLNSFIWGPDGWLYGCHGVFTHSRVGKPGTPDAQRIPINAGVWRYHPVRHTFEIFAEGTSNPWGLDYDQHGEFFVTACVIPHLYHIVPGGRYQRQAGQHFNPYTYDDIKTIADHAHYAGNPRPDVTFDKATGAGVMNSDTNALGGGHAHCGLAIYQSSLFPPTYRNQLLFGNLHGHRLVANYTDVKGSSYIGKHAADFMRANDMHFIPVTQKVGPDGALYVSDWSDQQICHRGSGAVEQWDRSNGRIYKVSYVGERGVSAVVAGVSDPGGAAHRQPPAAPSKTGPTLPGADAKPLRTGVTDPSYNFPVAPFDLAKESDKTLVKLAVQTENEWFSRMARRVLMEKVATATLTKHEGPGLHPVESALWNSLGGRNAIKGIWGLGSLSSIKGAGDFRDLCRHPDEHTAIWAIRFVAEQLKLSLRRSNAVPAEIEPTYGAWYGTELHQLATKSPSPALRRELASLVIGLPVGTTWKTSLATALLAHGEEKDDPMIPLLVWYGIEPVVAADAEVGIQLAKVSKMPKVTEFIYRRLAAEPEGRLMLLRNLVKPAASQKPTGEGKKVLWKMKTDLRPALQTASQDSQTDAQDVQTDAQGVQTAAQDAQIDTQDCQTDAQDVQTDAQGVQTAAQDAQIDTQDVQIDAQDVQTDAQGVQTDAQDAQIDTQDVQIDTQDVQTDAQDVQTDAQGVQTDAQGVQTAAQDVQTAVPRFRFVAGTAKPGLLADLDATERERILEQVVQQARQAGRQQPPADWAELSAALRAGASPRFSTLLDELAALFGDAAALGQFRATLADAKRSAAERQPALSLLIQAGDAGTAKVLQGMLVDSATPGELRRKALQALASLRDDSTTALISSLLPKLSANELPDAVNTLASTKEGAKALLKAVEAKTVPPTALSPFLVRQLAAFNDPEINAGIKSAWGDLNAPKADLEERKKKFRTLLAPAILAKADKAKGKILFSAVCGSCHQLFGEGQKVGPELTGSNRANLDYLLDNVLDPNAVIGKDYQLNLFELNDGRVASGVVKEATPAAYRIAMPGGIEQTISVSEVKARTIAKVSTMPEGLFDSLPPEALQQLVAYLQSNSSASKAEGKVAVKVEGALEGEALKVLEITGGKAAKQGMGGFGSEWSGGAQLWWTQGKPDQKLTLAIPVKEAGRYTLYGALTMARDYGVVSITLDGKPVASSFDGYNGPKVIHTGERDWGTHALTTGEHQLTFTLAPPNPAAAPSHMVGLDYVRLEKN